MTEVNHTENVSRWSDWTDWIDAQDVMQKLHISPRTLQTWRTNGILFYSRIRGKLYYRISDILSLLNENYNGKNKNYNGKNKEQVKNESL